MPTFLRFINGFVLSASGAHFSRTNTYSHPTRRGVNIVGDPPVTYFGTLVGQAMPALAFGPAPVVCRISGDHLPRSLQAAEVVVAAMSVNGNRDGEYTWIDKATWDACGLIEWNGRVPEMPTPWLPPVDQLAWLPDGTFTVDEMRAAIVRGMPSHPDGKVRFNGEGGIISGDNK